MVSTHPYDELTPDVVLQAVEEAGMEPDGRLLALNSYENRVYQLGVGDGTFVVAKFYRPGRWSEAQIREEHQFAAELAEQEIPVVAPLANPQGETLHRHGAFLFALFPRHGGRWPELEDGETLFRLGRFLGRIHTVGESHPFMHRPAIDVESFGRIPSAWLLERGFIPPEYRAEYSALTGRLLEEVARAWSEPVGRGRRLRLHGDFHAGNILWTDRGAHLVDLDDARTGPAVQDLWMLLSGGRSEMSRQLGELLEGYQEFRDFDLRELRLIEPLRTLRLIHYAYWLASRWDDPAFPHSFPWFNTPRYWEEHLTTLREQERRHAEPAITVF